MRKKTTNQTQQNARAILRRLTKRWRHRLLLSHMMRSFAIAASAAFFLRLYLTLSLSALILTAVIFFMVSFVAAILLGRFQSVDEERVAYHLNRMEEELEESSHLLLQTGAGLSFLQRLQRNRIAPVMVKLETAQTLPERPLKMAWIFGVLGIVLFAITAFLPASSNSPTGVQTPRAESAEVPATADPVPGELSITSVSIQIQPPAYTGVPSRRSHDFNVRLEENSKISWEVTFNKSIAASYLIFSDGDTIRFKGHRDTHVCIKRISKAGFYFVAVADSSFRQISKFFRLDVVRDEPPTIVVLEPQPRTEFLPEGRPKVTLHALVDDDYRVADAKIFATVTRGSGESIKFREQVIQFNQALTGKQKNVHLTKTLDLRELALNPGDELYFFVQAEDNKSPAPNRSRSETFFVTLKDTSGLTLSVAGRLAVNPIPEYFRSQRQIIIDTEKLISDRAEISEGEFKRRSNNLGVDQKALRLRYGQFLGEEFESGLAMNVIEQPLQHAIPGLEGEQHEHDPATFGEETKGPLDIVPEELRHDHDFEENATLFSKSIKEQLHAALAEMWDAELYLRTFKPSEALPFEYRALVLLKKVQQASRLYVKRIGFEPTPLKPVENRLSADLSKIENQTENRTVLEERIYPSIRAGLRTLQKLKSSSPLPAEETVNILQASGRELARILSENPTRYIATLNDLLTVMTNIENSQRLCRPCLLNAERTFWNVLPVAGHLTTKKRATRSGLTELYLRKLAGVN